MLLKRLLFSMMVVCVLSACAQSTASSVAQQPDNVTQQSANVATPAVEEFDDRYVVNFAAMSPKDWCYPLPGAKVISPYGGRNRRGHSGVDIKTKPADDIFAAFDGVVTMSESYYGYGKCIIIRHAFGIETLYSHNKKNLVKVGDHVKAGQKIALTGQTGRATTPHLHFEGRLGGRPFDPAILWDHNTHTLRLETFTFYKDGRVARGGKVVGSVSKKSSKSKSKSKSKRSKRRSKKRK